MTLRSYEDNLAENQEREVFDTASGIACPLGRRDCWGEMMLRTPERIAPDTKLRRAKCARCDYLGWV